MPSYDIVIVGAGAAGLATAIFAAEGLCDGGAGAGSARILVLDGATAIGAKILISGGGRCNVTNAEVTPLDYNGSRNPIRNVLAAFDVAATCRWFAGLGVELVREDTGKLFPVANTARSVLAALLKRCRELDIDVRTAHRVHAVHRAPAVDGGDPAGFVVEHAHGSERAARVVLATGGRSLPRTGSDGGGFDIARSLGHSVTDTFPALAPLVLAGDMFHAELSGLSQPVELSTFADGKRIDRRTGSLLWTHFGISGPVVLDASRHWIIAHAHGQRAELTCNFLPGQDFESCQRWLQDVAGRRPRLSLARALAERLPDRLGRALARRAACDPATPLGQLARPARRSLAQRLTAFALPIARDRGWNFAEVTAGGVPLDEIDYRTMESRRAPGLHLVGEMLDCDGRIGGFNFQWAWASGRVAGRAAAAVCRQRDGTVPTPRRSGMQQNNQQKVAKRAKDANTIGRGTTL